MFVNKRMAYIFCLIGILVVVFGLLGIFFTHKNESQLIFLVTAGILLGIIGIFFIKGYRNKTYYLASFSMVVLFGVVSIVINSNLYFNIAICLILLLGYSRSFKHRENDSEVPWKNEW